MTVKTLDSNQARNNWREMLDTVVVSGVDVVITRYNQPIAAVVSYEDYVAMANQLAEMRTERAKQRALAESRATFLASEQVLAREWESPEEDEAWTNL